MEFPKTLKECHLLIAKLSAMETALQKETAELEEKISQKERRPPSSSGLKGQSVIPMKKNKK